MKHIKYKILGLTALALAGCSKSPEAEPEAHKVYASRVEQFADAVRYAADNPTTQVVLTLGSMSANDSLHNIVLPRLVAQADVLGNLELVMKPGTIYPTGKILIVVAGGTSHITRQYIDIPVWDYEAYLELEKAGLRGVQSRVGSGPWWDSTHEDLDKWHNHSEAFKYICTPDNKPR